MLFSCYSELKIRFKCFANDLILFVSTLFISTNEMRSFLTSSSILFVFYATLYTHCTKQYHADFVIVREWKAENWLVF